MKTYGRIDEFKRMEIKVILNDNEVLYEGKIEDAPMEIKEKHFNKAILGKITEIYIYDDKKWFTSFFLLKYRDELVDVKYLLYRKIYQILY